MADYGFSFCQRFALCQFLLSRWGMASCYGALEHLAESYAANYPHRAAAPLDEGTVADAANDILRELCVLGRFAEALARADLGEPPAPAEKAAPAETAAATITTVTATTPRPPRARWTSR